MERLRGRGFSRRAFPWCCCGKPTDRRRGHAMGRTCEWKGWIMPSSRHGISLYTRGERRTIRRRNDNDKQNWESMQSLQIGSTNQYTFFAYANNRSFVVLFLTMEQSKEMLDKYRGLIDSLLKDPALRRIETNGWWCRRILLPVRLQDPKIEAICSDRKIPHGFGNNQSKACYWILC